MRDTPTSAGAGLLLLVFIVGVGADLAVGLRLGDARRLDDVDRATLGGNRMRFAIGIRVGGRSFERRGPDLLAFTVRN